MAATNIIVIGNSPFHRGGAGPWAHHTLTNLLSAGHRVRAVFPIYPDKAEWRAAFRLRYPAVQAVWYDMPTAGDPFSDVPINQLERQLTGMQTALDLLLDQEEADLIYLTKESSIWGISEFARTRGLRCLATLHGNLLTMVQRNDRAVRRQAWIELYRQAELVTCCAEHMTRSLGAAGLDNLVTLPNGVDVGRFRPRCRPTDLAARFGIASDDVVMLHASNLHSIKRPLDLVRAFAGAVRRNDSLRLVIVGDGDMRCALEREARRLGVDRFIRLVGWVENGEMPNYYALADFTVLPSASEGLSMACLESMACGRFVVASDIPASRELIEDRVDGLLFPVGDVDALAEAMVDAAGTLRRGTLGDAARSRIERNFSLSRMQRRQLAIIERLTRSGASDRTGFRKINRT